MPHKELVIYVSEYVLKNTEVLKPVGLSLQVLCWPHMDKLDEVCLSLHRIDSREFGMEFNLQFA